MNMQADAGLWESAIFGQEVENFLASRVGEYLLTYSQAQIAEAQVALEKVSPWRRRRIRDLQDTIRCWRGFEDRMRQAIEDGRNATASLEEMHEDRIDG